MNVIFGAIGIQTIIGLTLLALLLAAVVLVILVKTAPHKKQSPSAQNDDVIPLYEADLKILRRCIDCAFNTDHLDKAEDAVKRFQNNYSDYINSASLQFDINELEIQLWDRRVWVSERKALAASNSFL